MDHLGSCSGRHVDRPALLRTPVRQLNHLDNRCRLLPLDSRRGFLTDGRRKVTE